jgi:ribosomal protein S11
MIVTVTDVPAREARIALTGGIGFESHRRPIKPRETRETSSNLLLP